MPLRVTPKLVSYASVMMKSSVELETRLKRFSISKAAQKKTAYPESRSITEADQ